MSKLDKAIDRFKSLPKDLTWNELIVVLASFGYNELKTGKTGGSRRKFARNKMDIITLHKPHPGNIVKMYAIRQVLNDLKEKGIIEDE